MNVSNMTKTIEAELTKYSEEYANKVKNYTEEIAKECADELKRTSPRSKLSKKKYADGWIYEKAYENSCGSRYRIRNKNKPQLTHLLEYGHAKVNGGRVDAQPHIKSAEEKAKSKLIKLIKEN